MKSSIELQNNSRAHFIIRLKERYDIQLSEQEYDDIIERQFKLNCPGKINLYALTGSTNLYYIKIKNRWVLCVYVGGRAKRLKTALDVNGYAPVPITLRRIGLTSGVFELEVNKIIEMAYSLIPVINSMSRKEFFVNHPENRHIKNMTMQLSIGKELSLYLIVKHIMYKYEPYISVSRMIRRSSGIRKFRYK